MCICVYTNICIRISYAKIEGGGHVMVAVHSEPETINPTPKKQQHRKR